MSFLTTFKQEKFKYFLIISLLLVFLFLIPRNNSLKNVSLDKNLKIEQEVMYIFVQKGCAYCVKVEKFLDGIQDDYPNIKFEYHDLAYNQSTKLLFQFIAQLDIDKRKIGTPIIVSGDRYIIGYDNEENKGKQIKDLLEKRNGKYKKEDKEQNKFIKIPFFGKIDIMHTSLPVLAMTMGLVDGFNPCAMWVLVYLISIVVGLYDKKKIWFLVGTFVVSSGILYFLFMTAWLNVFLFLGYVRILAIAVGLFALYFGIMQVFEFIKNHGEVVCKLSNNKTRKNSIKKIDKIVQAELTMFSIFGIIALAFVVNSIEFACSAVLPAMFTFVLTQAGLSTFMYYMYILLYTLFFMLDDFIIFGLAVIAVNKTVGTKYEKYSGVIGGAIMILIGIIIVFFPNVLR